MFGELDATLAKIRRPSIFISLIDLPRAAASSMRATYAHRVEQRFCKTVATGSCGCAKAEHVAPCAHLRLASLITATKSVRLLFRATRMIRFSTSRHLRSCRCSEQSRFLPSHCRGSHSVCRSWERSSKSYRTSPPSPRLRHPRLAGGYNCDPQTLTLFYSARALRRGAAGTLTRRGRSEVR